MLAAAGPLSTTYTPGPSARSLKNSTRTHQQPLSHFGRSSKLWNYIPPHFNLNHMYHTISIATVFLSSKPFVDLKCFPYLYHALKFKGAALMRICFASFNGGSEAIFQKERLNGRSRLAHVYLTSHSNKSWLIIYQSLPFVYFTNVYWASKAECWSYNQ